MAVRPYPDWDYSSPEAISRILHSPFHFCECAHRWISQMIFVDMHHALIADCTDSEFWERESAIRRHTSAIVLYLDSELKLPPSVIQDTEEVAVELISIVRRWRGNPWQLICDYGLIGEINGAIADAKAILDNYRATGGTPTINEKETGFSLLCGNLSRTTHLKFQALRKDAERLIRRSITLANLRSEREQKNAWPSNSQVLSNAEDGNDLIPFWNKDKGVLTFNNNIIRQVKRQGSGGKPNNVVIVLDSFQETGWPSRIDDPLPGGANPPRLNETVKSLNKGISCIRFRADGSGGGIVWEQLDQT